MAPRTSPLLAEVPLPGDQLPVPTENRVRCDQRDILAEEFSSENLALHGQTTSLIVREPKPSAAQLLLEDPILFSQVVENGFLQPSSRFLFRAS